jgi:hypothetical protein
MATAEQIFEEMMEAGQDAFGAGWGAVRQFAPTEFRKMALQIEEIARNVALNQLDATQGYSVETGKLLMKMQRNACESVLVATTQLTMIAVQKAMDAMYDVLRKAFKGVIEAVL